MAEHPGSLLLGGTPGRRSARHRVGKIWIAHGSEVEQPRHRGHPPVHRGRGIASRAPAAKLDHVATLPGAHHDFAAGCEVSQQRIGPHRVEDGAVGVQPSAEMQQIEGIRPHRPRRLPAVNQVREEIIDGPEAGFPRAADNPASALSLHAQCPIILRHDHEPYVSPSATPLVELPKKLKEISDPVCRSAMGLAG